MFQWLNAEIAYQIAAMLPRTSVTYKKTFFAWLARKLRNLLRHLLHR